MRIPITLITNDVLKRLIEESVSISRCKRVRGYIYSDEGF